MAKETRKSTLAAIRKAEKTARAKLKRFQARGVRTGSINPIKPVDTSSNAKAKNYLRELERFNARSNQYVAGRDGTPISKKDYTRFKQVEQEWNKAHNRYWRTQGARPFIIPGGESDVSIAEMSSYVHMRGQPFGDVFYQRSTDVSKIRGAKDLQRRTEAMLQELHPDYRLERTRALRTHVEEWITGYNDPELLDEVVTLTDEQLTILHETSDFVEMIFHNYPGQTSESIIEALEQANTREHLLNLIASVKKRYPMDTPQTRAQPQEPKTNTSKKTVSQLKKSSNKRRHRR